MAAKVSIKESKTILEGNLGTQNLTFDIVLSEAILEPVTVGFSITNVTDTAIIDEDYTVNFDPIVFNPGDPLTKTITFVINGDRKVEADEVFTITLGNLIGATLGTNSIATGTILNDDTLPKVSIAATSNAQEPNSTGSFTLTRTGGDINLPLTVNLNYLGSTATVNTDYSTAPTQVTFAAGASTATVAITPIDDDLYEGTETVKLSISNSESYQIGDSLGGGASAEISILDNENLPRLGIVPRAQNIIERNTGNPANSASFQVLLTGKSATDIIVNYTTGNGSATAGSDYTATSGQLIFPAGSNNPQTILVPIIPDNDLEPDENFGVELTPSASSEVIIDNSDRVGIAIITNDDSPPSVGITRGIDTREPGDVGTFILNRTGGNTQALTVNLIPSGGTATPGIDYQVVNTATFAAGSSTAVVEIRAINDDIYEEIETIALAVQPGRDYLVGGFGGPNTATIFIGDDESRPFLVITPTIQSITEKNTGDTLNNASFQIQLTGKSATPISAEYSAINGTATAGSDFIPVNGQVFFAPGTNTPQTILIPIIPDNNIEPDESFSLQLINAIGADSTGGASITILNDDGLPTINIAAGLNSQEPNTNSTFILSRTGNTTSALTVNLAEPTGSATSGIDYLAISSTATFAAGSSNAVVEIKPIDDDIYETTEKVGLAILAGSGYTLGTTTNAEISITDNEAQPSLSVTINNQLIKEENIGATANNATFQIQLTGQSATPITVDYTTVNGSAQAGSDFTAATGQLTFAPGSTIPQTVFVPITPDNDVEVDENFTFRLFNANGASLGPPATAIIFNDDSIPLPKITINPIGNQNLPVEQLPTQQTITLKRDGEITQPLTIKYLLSRSVGGTNQNTNSTATFASGQSEVTIPLTINNIAIYREIEQDILTLTADPNYNLDDLNKTVTINLGNNLNPPNINISDAEIIEGDSGTSLLRFTARLSSPSAQATTVNYQTSNGTAIAGRDYTASTGILTFAAKEVEKTIEISVINETIVENNENFTITLSNPSSGITLSKATATGLIKNNDIPIASLIVTDAQAGELNNLGQFQIAIEAAAEVPVTIKYGITGAATPGADYITLPGTVTIAPGQTSQTIDVTVQDDTLVESAEIVQLQLQASPDYTIAPDKNSGTVAISDNDALPQLTTLQSSLFQIQNGIGTSLKFRKTSHQALYRNELSLFIVDDDNGSINGIAPNQTAYKQAALGRAQIVFSALGDSSVDLQLDGQIDRYLQLGANDRFALMLVANSSINELKRGVNADVLFSFPTVNNNNLYTRITKQGSIQQVAWEDTRGGDGDFNDLGVEISIEQAPNIIGTEQQGSKEVIDLRSFTGKKTCDIQITGDAYYSNTVGLYTVDDLDSKINGLSIGDTGYVAAALNRAIASGKKGDNFSVQVDGGTILNSFMVANSSVAKVLDKTTSTDAVFFGNTVVGNADKADHVRLLGDNKFGFEDLWGGGDRDFNDVVLQVVVRP
jgi:Calx-beta domain/Domain of unknown function (DUF4114)